MRLKLTNDAFQPFGTNPAKLPPMAVNNESVDLESISEAASDQISHEKIADYFRPNFKVYTS